MKDIDGTIVIAEAVKNANTEHRIEKIAADLLCVLCDNDCTVNEAFAALDRAHITIQTTRMDVAENGNNVETEDSYAEGED